MEMRALGRYPSTLLPGRAAGMSWRLRTIAFTYVYGAMEPLLADLSALSRMTSLQKPSLATTQRSDGPPNPQVASVAHHCRMTLGLGLSCRPEAAKTPLSM